MEEEQLRQTDAKPEDLDTPILRSGGGWVWSNIILAVLLFVAVQWYLHNVYRYRPWIPTVTFHRAQIAVGMVYGWLAHPFLAALSKGKIGALLNPVRFLDPDTARMAGRKGVTVTLAIATIVVAAGINLFPILHLRYDADVRHGDAVPVVLVDGRAERFQENTIPILEFGEELPSVVVTGNHNLYRVPLSADDVKRAGLTTHKRVILNDHFLYEDLEVVLTDTSGASVAQFTIVYDSEQSPEEQCVALEGMTDVLRDNAGCADLLRATLDRIAGNLTRTDTGSVSYRGRNYHYDYALNDGANLRIRVPPAISELTRFPGRALEVLGGSSQQDSLLAELREDLGNLSVTALNRLFLHLFRTNGFRAHLQGAIAEQQLVLKYVRDVLSLGVEHVGDSATTALVDDIVRFSLGPRSPDRVFVPAIEALVAISQDNRNLRLDVLARVNAFLRELDTGYNRAKPAMAGILADMLYDEIDTDIADGVLEGLATLYSTAEGVAPVVASISEVVAGRRDDLTREDLLLGLDRLRDRDPDAAGSDEGAGVGGRSGN
jgi:hypothetical protein